MRLPELQGGTEPVDYYIFHKGAFEVASEAVAPLLEGWPCGHSMRDRLVIVHSWVRERNDDGFCKTRRDAAASGTWPIYTNRLMVDDIYGALTGHAGLIAIN